MALFATTLPRSFRIMNIRLNRHKNSHRDDQILWAFVVFGLILLLSGCATSSSKTSVAGKQVSANELPFLYLDMGTSALMSEDYPLAIEYLTKSMDLDQKNPVTHNHFGLALLGMGQNSRAVEHFHNAVKLDPNYSDAYVNLGTFYYSYQQPRDLEKSKQFYLKALENLSYRNRERPLASLAQVMMTEGSTEKAKEYAAQALSFNPSYCLAHLILGNLYSRDGESQKAAASYRASIRGTCAKNAEGQLKLGDSYSRLGDYQKARTQYLQVMEQFPNSVAAQEAGEQLRKLP